MDDLQKAKFDKWMDTCCGMEISEYSRLNRRELTELGVNWANAQNKLSQDKPMPSEANQGKRND